METKFNSLLEANLSVTATLTKPTKPGKKPRPVYIITGNTYGLDEIFRDLGGRTFRGQWSFWEDPSAALLSELNARGRLSFSEQIEAKNERRLNRIDRYTGYGENAKARAEERSQAAKKISSMIPFGQPILIGHHSEKRHRSDLDRIHSNIGKSIEESEKAEYFENRVAGIEHALDRQQSRTYIGNRLRKAEAALRRLDRSKSYYSDYEIRRKIAQEKVDHWQSELDRMGRGQRELGVNIPQPSLVKKGHLVKYRGTWYPVVRVSPKSVTISNWLGIKHFTRRLEYSGISEFQASTSSTNIQSDNSNQQETV